MPLADHSPASDPAPGPVPAPEPGEMQQCDLIMKGGITSGVVYPGAIVKLAQDYRLRSIGGSSAGAIAACFAAAAEYQRQERGGHDMTGFQAMSALAAELARKLKTLFQPSPRFRPLFALLIAGTSGQGMAGALLHVLRWPLALSGAVAVLGLVLAIRADSLWLGVSVVLATLILLVAFVVWWLARLVLRDLPAADFGICPGITQPGHDDPALTDWMIRHIEDLAGRPQTGAPLTVGDLGRHGITLAAMTTDLSSGRPYQLPMLTNIHWFSLAEWQRLFPPHFLDALTAGHDPLDHGQDAPADLYPLPARDAFPVLLVARMSLSFPGLLQAVPLYRYDDQVRVVTARGETAGRISRCLFSDGGISSNFPIHFFDALLPRRPTFGIALGSYDPARHGDERTDLPRHSVQSTDLPVIPVRGLGDFMFAILNTAKDWQDRLQAMLPGYSERVVTVRLDDATEGGMNLGMDEATIARLNGFGLEAGEKLLATYSYARGADGFDRHRDRRGRVTVPRLAAALNGMGLAMASRPDGAPEAPDGRAAMVSLSQDCAGFADAVAALPSGACQSDLVADAEIRLSAHANRAPRHAAQPMAAAMPARPIS